MNSQAEPTKQVLVIYGDRRRPVTFNCGSNKDGDDCTKEEYEWLVKAVESVFEDVLSAEEGSSTSSGAFYLQMESSEWGGTVIDVTSRTLVPDHGVVFLHRHESRGSVGSKDYEKRGEKGTKESKQVKGLCQKLRIPSETTKEALSSLFPACASAKKKRKFDPHEACVAASQQHKKKAANPNYKGRSKALEVVVLKELSVIPRGPSRDRLEETGRIKEIHIHRIMSAVDHIQNNFLKSTNFITTSFKDVGIMGYKYLSANRRNKLTVAEKQQLNGNDVIKLAGSGSLYLQQCVGPKSQDKNVSDHESQQELICISSDDENDVTNIQVKKSERQIIIEQQDRAYYESLQIDVAKDEAKAKAVGDEKVELEDMQTQWTKRVNDLQGMLKLKFAGNTEPEGIKVAFKLLDGRKIEQVFSKKAVVKDLYQFVLSEEALSPFVLYMPHPPTALPLSVMANESIAPYNNVLLLVILRDYDEGNPLDDLDTLACIDHEDFNEKSHKVIVNEDDGMLDGEKLLRDEEERVTFMTSINAVPGRMHLIDRARVYEEVIDLYQNDDILKEFPIYVKFKGEMAVDHGGVHRDMFSAFWEQAYGVLFEGATLLTPMFHPEMDMSLFSTIGRILSHSFLVSGVLPIRIALPTLVHMLLGPGTTVSDRIVLNTFLDFISAWERNTFKKALVCSGTSFPPELLEELMTTLGRFECRQLPTPSTLPNIIFQVARYKFITKPAASIAMIHSGVPKCHQGFWNNTSPHKICTIYEQLTVSPKKVNSLFTPPMVLTSQEERVYSYLQIMVGNMNSRELRLLMRFVTGSCVCNTSCIEVSFNSLSGLARRPIAHTCSCMLEIPTTYINYDDFTSDFQAILQETNENFAWRMDSL